MSNILTYNFDTDIEEFIAGLPYDPLGAHDALRKAYAIISGLRSEVALASPAKRIGKFSTIVRFEIPDQPLPKERARVVGRRAYTPERTKAYEMLVKWYASMSYNDNPVTCDLWVTVNFYRYKKRRADIDNLIKSIFDGCNGTIWHDDKQVIALTTMIEYNAKQPCTVVEVKKIA